MNMKQLNNMQIIYMEAVCAIQNTDFLTDTGLVDFMYYTVPNHCEVRQW